MKKKTRKYHPSDGFTYRQHIKFIYSIRIQNDSFATVQQKKLVAVLQAESAALAMKRLAIHLKMMNRAKKYKANGNASTTTTTKKSLRISFQLKWFPICWYPIMLAGFMHFPSIDIRCMYVLSITIKADQWQTIVTKHREEGIWLLLLFKMQLFVHLNINFIHSFVWATFGFSHWLQFNFHYVIKRLLHDPLLKRNIDSSIESEFIIKLYNNCDYPHFPK